MRHDATTKEARARTPFWEIERDVSLEQPITGRKRLEIVPSETVIGILAALVTGKILLSIM
jgi:hypothetical protein